MGGPIRLGCQFGNVANAKDAHMDKTNGFATELLLLHVKTHASVAPWEVHSVKRI